MIKFGSVAISLNKVSHTQKKPNSKCTISDCGHGNGATFLILMDNRKTIWLCDKCANSFEEAIYNSRINRNRP